MDKLKIKVLVTGANGFLGQKLIEKLCTNDRIELFATSNQANRNFIQKGYQFIRCDLQHVNDFEKLLTAVRPDRIIHTAAISSVEACEKEPELCRHVNIDTVKTIATYCEKHNKHLVHLSTDFVFDGSAGPYAEEHATKPLNAYGQSKLQSEEILLGSKARAAILRTILVYGVNGDKNRSNLVLWAKSALEKGQNIRVVSDQWRMPTFVDDLVDACLYASEQEATGTYHISGNEMRSILEVVQQVADFWGLDKTLIQSITAADIGQDKNRPAKTGFILDKAIETLGYKPTPFTLSLQQIAVQLKYYNR